MEEILGFLPLLLLVGIILLIILCIKNPKKIGRILLFAFIGGVLGIPLSYFFQSTSNSITSYLRHFENGLTEDFVGNVIISVLIFAVIGTIIGYLITKKS
ncbi:hypothetical protein [Mesoflavibacter zeaxanthinifaciens]|jgi:uncharacterized membrane protein YdbT with pleckstrin-like domain|uniref:hypothetical protein n=1 Tax=Mesoflavibacter zeaxanthinifaciens TaxID=393060 RepID=UPI003A8F832F